MVCTTFSPALFPVASFLVLVVFARATILQVHDKIIHTWPRFPALPVSGIAPTTKVPFGSFWNFGLWCTEHWSRCTIPFCMRCGENLHLRIHFALHMRICAAALVILIALAQLS